MADIGPSMMDLAENVNNPGFGDDRLLVKFTTEPVKNEEKSAAEGRPVFDEEEFISIRIPGDKTSVIHRRIRDTDKRRFAKAYAHWKSTGEGERTTGTPLALWPQVTRAQVEELAFFNVKTVEQLANIADVHAQKFMGINALRDKARAFVQAAQAGAPIAAMQDELKAKDNTIATMQAAIEDMKAQLADLRRGKK